MFKIHKISLHFFHESYLLRIQKNNSIKTRSIKICVTWCQFHQCFYVQIFFTNGVSVALCSFVLALAKKFVQKMCVFNVDEIDYWLTL
jgi:hypothetical protein